MHHSRRSRYWIAHLHLSQHAKNNGVEMITQADLKRQLHYDPETGLFTRLTCTSNKSLIGRVAGGPTKNEHGKPYIRIWLNRKHHKAHRLAHLYMNGKFPNQTDHEDGDGTNNKWENISREVDNIENSKNARLQSNNTSGFCGVSWNTKRQEWRASIKTDGAPEKYLGSFTDKQEAIKARQAANIKYGFHKNHGQKRAL